MKQLFLNFIIKYGFIARKMLGEGLLEADRLPFLDYSTVAAAGNGVLESYGWYSQNAGKLMEFNQAKTNVQKLIGFMEQVEDAGLPKMVYAVKQGATNAIELKDFSVGYAKVTSIGHETVTLLNPQTLIIPQGIYAVSGVAGSGKTSFLSKIQGIKYNNLWGSGQVTYVTPSGEAPVIHQATQVDYLVPYATLLEIITSQASVKGDKNAEAVALEARVKALLLESVIDDRGEAGLVADLYAEKDWATILSGGQKRKVALIGTILKQPNIVILDEVFNGLDEASIRTAQRMLKQYLPDTLMLIVDHHYADNNYELENGQKFYDGQVSLNNMAVELLD